MVCLFRASRRSSFVLSTHVGEPSIVCGTGRCQRIVRRGFFLNMSGSDWTDLGSGSHGFSVRNGRNGVTLILYLDGSDLLEMVGNTISRVCSISVQVHMARHYWHHWLWGTSWCMGIVLVSGSADMIIKWLCINLHFFHGLVSATNIILGHYNLIILLELMVWMATLRV